MPATQSTPESVPLVPHEPTISGMPAVGRGAQQQPQVAGDGGGGGLGVPEPR